MLRPASLFTASSLLPLFLLLGCGGRGCTQEPTVQVEPVEPIEPVAPEADAWVHPWSWAVVVQVDAAAPEPATLDPADPRAVALEGSPVVAFRAAPGSTLTVDRVRPGTSPATVQVPADASGWLLITDQGQRALSGSEAEQARMARLALGLDPWRVLILVDTDHRPGARHDSEAEVRARLDAAGIQVVEATATDMVPVPWADDPLQTIDVAALLAARLEGRAVEAGDAGAGAAGAGEAGAGEAGAEGAGAGEAGAEGAAADAGQGFYILAMAGKEPRVVAVDPPLRLMLAGSRYFEVELMPERAGKGGKAGKAGKGPGMGQGRGKGKAAPFLRGKSKGGFRKGKAGQLRSKAGDGPPPGRGMDRGQEPGGGEPAASPEDAAPDDVGSPEGDAD